MINLLYDGFPDAIRADGLIYPIRTDFRVWLRFADILTDKQHLTKSDMLAALLSVFKNPVTYVSDALIDSIFRFYHADLLDYHPEYDEESPQTTSKPPVFDWKIDARYVLGDFRHYYQLDLISVEYLHWFKFKALFDALPEDSNCMKRMAYRGADLNQIKNDAEKKRIRKIKRAVALPYEMPDGAIGAALMF